MENHFGSLLLAEIISESVPTVVEGSWRLSVILSCLSVDSKLFYLVRSIQKRLQHPELLVAGNPMEVLLSLK